jgi:hypothetical protein
MYINTLYEYKPFSTLKNVNLWNTYGKAFFSICKNYFVADHIDVLYIYNFGRFPVMESGRETVTSFFAGYESAHPYMDEVLLEFRHFRLPADNFR